MATYYIDFASGNDSNAGTSTGAAWKTIPGTRTTNDSDWQSSDWGSGTINNSNKVPAGTTFKLKSGTTHDSSNGGSIRIEGTYYDHGTSGSPITIQRDTSWGSGAITFDATGFVMVSYDATIFTNRNYTVIDGVVTDGIVLQDASIEGIRVSVSGTTVTGVTLQYLKLYNNGTSFSGDNGSGNGQVLARNVNTFTVQYCTFDGNNNSICGIIPVETIGTNVLVDHCTFYNHYGTDDCGIGLKGFNCDSLTVSNCESYSNFKGFDFGEEKYSTSANLQIKYINNIARNNTESGMNANGWDFPNSATGTVNFYYINNIIRDNGVMGAKVYSGPFNLYMVHNVFDNNGTSGPTTPDYCNLIITKDENGDEAVASYMYNNIFYKPGGQSNFCVQRWYDDCYNYLLEFDYNSWVQRASEDFCEWSYFVEPEGQFAYGANGPGHSSGNWYNWYGFDTSANAIGHYHSSVYAKGTGCDDTTLPPFTDVGNHIYTLTESYTGVDISGKPWYVSEMGTDKNGTTRSNWDMGAYEYYYTSVMFNQSVTLRF